MLKSLVPFDHKSSTLGISNSFDTSKSSSDQTWTDCNMDSVPSVDPDTICVQASFTGDQLAPVKARQTQFDQLVFSSKPSLQFEAPRLRGPAPSTPEKDPFLRKPQTPFAKRVYNSNERLSSEQTSPRLGFEHNELLTQLSLHGVNPSFEVINEALEQVALSENTSWTLEGVLKMIRTLENKRRPNKTDGVTQKNLPPLDVTYFSPSANSPTSKSFTHSSSSIVPSTPPTSTTQLPPTSPTLNVSVNRTPTAKKNGRLRAFSESKPPSHPVVAAAIEGLGRVLVSRDILFEKLGKKNAHQAIEAAKNNASYRLAERAVNKSGSMEHLLKAGPLDLSCSTPPKMNERLCKVRLWLDSPEKEILEAKPKEAAKPEDLVLKKQRRSPSPSRISAAKEKEETHCFCGTTKNVSMVQCDSCQMWYHQDCLKLTPADLLGEWYCPTCEASKKLQDKVPSTPKVGPVLVDSMTTPVQSGYYNPHGVDIPLAPSPLASPTRRLLPPMPPSTPGRQRTEFPPMTPVIPGQRQSSPIRPPDSLSTPSRDWGNSYESELWSVSTPSRSLPSNALGYDETRYPQTPWSRHTSIPFGTNSSTSSRGIFEFSSTPSSSDSPLGKILNGNCSDTTLESPMRTGGKKRKHSLGPGFGQGKDTAFL